MYCTTSTVYCTQLHSYTAVGCSRNKFALGNNLLLHNVYYPVEIRHQIGLKSVDYGAEGVPGHVRVSFSRRHIATATRN